MKNESEIIELLSKKNLSNEDKILIKKSFEYYPGLKKYQSIFNILNNISTDLHLDIDIISDFVLYQNKQPVENKNFSKLIPNIENHLSTCEICQNEFNMLNNEYADIDSFVETQFEKVQKKNPPLRKENFLVRFFTNPFPRYSFAGAFGLVLLYFTLFGISELTTPKYKSLSATSYLNQVSTTRGRTSPEFQKGLSAIELGDYTSAITSLNKDIAKTKNDNTLFYTHYILGLVYLNKSESTFLGLFPSYNKTDIDNAIKNFDKVLSTNNTGLFENINYNSYYFLGRAYLLKDNFSNAKKYLKMVVSNKGDYFEEASILLSSIE